MAYLSDGPLMFNSVLPHGIPFQSHRLTSLDQSAWFHRDADPFEWMIFDQRSTAAAAGRGMNEGQIYGQDGRLPRPGYNRCCGRWRLAASGWPKEICMIFACVRV